MVENSGQLCLYTGIFLSKRCWSVPGYVVKQARLASINSCKFMTALVSWSCLKDWQRENVDFSNYEWHGCCQMLVFLVKTWWSQALWWADRFHCHSTNDLRFSDSSKWFCRPSQGMVQVWGPNRATLSTPRITFLFIELKFKVLSWMHDAVFCLVTVGCVEPLCRPQVDLSHGQSR